MSTDPIFNEHEIANISMARTLVRGTHRLTGGPTYMSHVEDMEEYDGTIQTSMLVRNKHIGFRTHNKECLISILVNMMLDGNCFHSLARTLILFIFFILCTLVILSRYTNYLYCYGCLVPILHFLK